MERLNLGAGNYPLEGWENVNPDNVDLSMRPWPWRDDSASEINASHILEHFTKTDGFLFLLQCYRILRPGGVLHLAVPDMDKFITCRLRDDYTPLDGYAWRSLDDLLGGNSGDASATEYDKHRYMYCEASLAWTLEKAGFDKVWRRSMHGETDNPQYEPISLYMDAMK